MHTPLDGLYFGGPCESFSEKCHYLLRAFVARGRWGHVNCRSHIDTVNPVKQAEEEGGRVHFGATKKSPIARWKEERQGEAS